MIVDLTLHPDDADDDGIRDAAARVAGVEANRITGHRILRRGIDARHRRVRLQLRIELGIDAPFEPAPEPPLPDLPDLSGKPFEAIVVGAGPCGLFAAWGLAAEGVRAVVLDRGRAVRGRRRDIARLNREHVLDPDSNYCFGEGGAGTFSDGKLYTRATKRGRTRDVIRLLVECGAPPRILVDARPHIGTNRLPPVITALRERLEAAGVPVRFESRVDDLLVEGGAVVGVALNGGETMRAPSTVLATGHSARDIYRLVHGHGIAIEAKPFALGVRIEHPQAHIDGIQYGDLAGHPQLGAAPYALRRTDDDGVGVYSFCMCPGGFIVAAATEDGGVVVNGMSPHARGSRFANSGMVVTIGPETFGEGALAGLDWQAAVEQAAFAAGGGGFRAPAQRVTDFLDGRVSPDLPDCSYRPGLTSADLRAALPTVVTRPLADALRFFERRRMRGYVTRDAVMVGTESRSSAPLRIPRDTETLLSSSHRGLYPAGEGAGYAGGIMSAALDGLRVAEAIARNR